MPNVLRQQQLKNLPGSHFFFKKEFPSFFFTRCKCREKHCELTIKKLRSRVVWSGVWLTRRDDKEESQQFDGNLVIHDAFNTLSNRQLEMWKKTQEERLLIHIL